MAEGTRMHVMSVELAIQRELEYRRKVASLKPDGDILKDLLPLQVLSASPTENPSPRPCTGSVSTANPTTIKVQTSNQTPQLLPAQSLIPSRGQWTVQRSPFPSQTPNPSHHESSSKRIPVQLPASTPIRNASPWRRQGAPPRPNPLGMKRKAASTASQRPPLKQQGLSFGDCITTDQFGIFFCKVCQVSCSGAICLGQHLKGHKHKAKLQQLQVNVNGGEEQLEQRPRCDLCQVWCTNDSHLSMHLKGQKHCAKAKLQELELAKKNGRQIATQRLWCELCQIWCMNEDALQQHLDGQKHAMNLHAIQEKSRHKRGGAAVPNLHLKIFGGKTVS